MVEKRLKWLAVVCCGCLLALSVYSCIRVIHCRRAAEMSARDLADCQALADRIVALSAIPAQASLNPRTLQDVSRKIEQAAITAGIPAASIISISPRAARRLSGDTPVTAQPTSVQIRQASLTQLVRFLFEVEHSGEEGGLKTTYLRISAPRTAISGRETETWSAELVLTYLVVSTR